MESKCGVAGGAGRRRSSSSVVRGGYFSIFSTTFCAGPGFVPGSVYQLNRDCPQSRSTLSTD